MLKPNPNGGFNASKWEEIDIPEPPRTGPCRYCKHEQRVHRFDERGNRPCRENSDWNAKMDGGPVSILIPNKKKIGYCPCMEYVPSDNLVYLEWKVKRGY